MNLISYSGQFLAPTGALLFILIYYIPSRSSRHFFMKVMKIIKVMKAMKIIKVMKVMKVTAHGT